METLQKQIATNSVEHALDTVRQLANRPRPLIDNHTLLAALEQLAHVARETGHAEKKKYDAIFRQCKPLLKDGHLASVVTRLLGDPEENKWLLKSKSYSSQGQPKSLPSGLHPTLLMHRPQMDIPARFWSPQGIWGCADEGAIFSATAVSRVAEWDILPATAQGAFLRIIV